MSKFYLFSSIENLHNTGFDTIKDCSLQWLYEDAAVLSGMVTSEYAENGCYVSNIEDLYDAVKNEIKRRIS